jgi:hypothetical protein
MPAKPFFDPFAHFPEAGPRAIQMFQHPAKFIIVEHGDTPWRR